MAKKQRSNRPEKTIVAVPVRTCSIKKCRRQATAWVSIRHGKTWFRGAICEPCFIQQDKEVWEPAKNLAAYKDWAAKKERGRASARHN